MHKFTKALAAIGLAAVMSQSAIAENLKLGFLVKQPEEPWFQTEWKFADKAGKDLGFEVIKIAVPDGEKTLNAIDSRRRAARKVSLSVRRIQSWVQRLPRKRAVMT